MSRTICFFGATGGVANACLTRVLNSGEFKAIALARTPEKLRAQLLNQQNLDEATIDGNLTIVKGDATSIEDVERALLARVSGGTDSSLPCMIITSVGGAPVFQFSVWQPLNIIAIDNPNICGMAADTLISALQLIYANQPNLAILKPAVTFTSTTGISKGAEDVPYWYRYLYHQLLYTPHMDKKAMEDKLCAQMSTPKAVFSSVTGIRPTILGGTGALKEATQPVNIRAGTENKPALGYFIQRADVGSWMYENVVRNQDSSWRGELISLTA